MNPIVAAPAPKKSFEGILDKNGKPMTPPPAVEPEVVIFNAALCANDISAAKLYAMTANFRMRWGAMLRRLDKDVITLCSHADIENNNDPRTSLVTFLTMHAASLVLGKRGELSEDLTDDEVQLFAEAVPYVKFCCTAELLRRAGFLAGFDPHYDVLNPMDTPLQLTDEHRAAAWQMYVDQQAEAKTKLPEPGD